MCHVGAMLESCWGPGDGRPVPDLKRAVDQLLEEFLLSGDIAEATRCISELNAPHFFHEIVKRAVSSAMDKSSERQVSMSQLLAHLFAIGKLSNHQAVKGFNRLNGIMADLSLDTPAAPSILAMFTDRAITDGILPANYAYVPSGMTPR